MEKVLQYTDLFVSIGILMLWIVLVAIIITIWVGSRITYNNFFKAAMCSLNFSSVDEARKGINNDFEVYRNKRFGFKSKSIVEMCQELENRMKLKGEAGYIGYSEKIEKLEKVISIIKDEYRFDDEKMNEVIASVRNNANTDEARKIKEYLIRLNAYHDGIIYEKDRSYKDNIEKNMRRKWVSNLGYFLGLVGSIASICSIMK